jgi:hypothetical protein
VRVFVVCMTAAWLATLAMSGAEAGPFTIAGFRRNTDLATLLDRYPRSSHDLTPGAGIRHRTAQDDEKAWIRDFFHRRGSGTYVLRLAPAESHDHVYYVQAAIHDGVTERLWVSFELPLESVERGAATKGNEARFPPCQGVLNGLAATYGKPAALPASWEEALESFNYAWIDASETMTLQCGRYRGRGAVFAMGVTIVARM